MHTIGSMLLAGLCKSFKNDPPLGTDGPIEIMTRASCRHPRAQLSAEWHSAAVDGDAYLEGQLDCSWQHSIATSAVFESLSIEQGRWSHRGKSTCLIMQLCYASHFPLLTSSSTASPILCRSPEAVELPCNSFSMKVQAASVGVQHLPVSVGDAAL